LHDGNAVEFKSDIEAALRRTYEHIDQKTFNDRVDNAVTTVFLAMEAAVGTAFQDAGRGELAGSNFFALTFRHIITPGIIENDTSVRNFVESLFRGP
jgi:hypothetical protein